MTMDYLRELKQFEDSKPSTDEYYDKLIDGMEALSGLHKELFIRQLLLSVRDVGKLDGIIDFKHRLSHVIPNM